MNIQINIENKSIIKILSFLDRLDHHLTESQYLALHEFAKQHANPEFLQKSPLSSCICYDIWMDWQGAMKIAYLDCGFISQEAFLQEFSGKDEHMRCILTPEDQQRYFHHELRNSKQ